jgi:hypothetical protein
MTLATIDAPQTYSEFIIFGLVILGMIIYGIAESQKKKKILNNGMLIKAKIITKTLNPNNSKILSSLADAKLNEPKYVAKLMYEIGRFNLAKDFKVDEDQIIDGEFVMIVVDKEDHGAVMLAPPDWEKETA